MYYIKDQELYTATAKVTAMSTLATATYRYAVLGSDAGSAVGDLSYYHPSAVHPWYVQYTSDEQ